MNASLKRRRRFAISAKQRAWNKSPRMSEVRKLARAIAEVERQKAPKCGARRKGGGACQRLPAAGRTRCRLHGGASGRGESWHVVQLPADPKRRAKKLREVERRRERQAARVAAMSPERRAEYEKRKRAMIPGGKSRREVARRDREARNSFVASRSRERVATPAEVELAAEIERLRARLVELNEPPQEDHPDDRSA